jgi:hypothetical protein
MIKKLQKLLDGMNNFDFDFDGTDIGLGLIGFTILVLWMKVLYALGACRFISGLFLE